MNEGGAGVVAARVVGAELLGDLGGFEMDALDWVIVSATFDGGPVDDIGRGSALRVAHVGLLIDFFRTGAGLAVGDKLLGCELGAFGAVNDVEEAEFDGVGQGDLEIQIPGRGRIFDF